MRKLSASNLVTSINQLDKKQVYNYVSPNTKGVIRIEGVDLPEGPIRIKRWNPSDGESEAQKKVESISS
jgi:type II restriction enzyme